MKILLDTNVLLWFISEDKKLPPDFRAAIMDMENAIYVSIASLWEIAIKTNIGKMELDLPFEDFFDAILENYDFKVLQIDKRHLCQYLKLPLHHRDPFDRLIYSQAVSENMTFLFTDAVFKLYKSG